VDTEPPTFSNCPTQPITVSVDQNGQLTAADFSVPQVSDNSGFVSWVRSEPANFKPPYFITRDSDVIYTAYDFAGNENRCVVKLRLPDTQAPLITCPNSYYVESEQDVPSLRLFFNETTTDVTINDVSNISEVTFDPKEAIVKMNRHITVTVSATDVFGNQASCKFQAVVRPAPCKTWSLPEPENGVKICSTKANGLAVDCFVQCSPGFQFVDEQSNKIKNYSCALGKSWQPSPVVPACVPISELSGMWICSAFYRMTLTLAKEPARYELFVNVVYPVATPVGDECLPGYSNLVATSFDNLDTTLSQRCSSSVQVFVRFLDARFYNYRNNVTANYTVQILPTVLQDVFYELCAGYSYALFGWEHNCYTIGFVPHT
uniref:HYR domain-containing protein n=1 Tax=Romanomermis culicivorax TaxID=13658 RepID=A0A915ITD3_ROMCU